MRDGEDTLRKGKSGERGICIMRLSEEWKIFKKSIKTSRIKKVSCTKGILL